RGWSDAHYTMQVDTGAYTRQQFIYDSIGYGYAQWTHYSRKALFYDYFKERKKTVADSETQIDFLIWEMKNFFHTQWLLCCQSSDLYQCTWELLDKWENPKNKDKAIVTRFDYAQNWYNEFKNLKVSGEQETETLNQNDVVETVLNFARNELGYHEKNSNSNLDDKNANAGSGNYTKYARELDSMTNWYNGAKNGYAWCDIFVDWLFYKCFGSEIGRQMICQPIRSAGAGCLYSAQYYKQAGKWHTSNPQPGDQIFFTYAPGEYSHTGIVEKVEGNSVITIEGNTSDMVARRSYPVNSGNIAGYGTPVWSLATGTPVTTTLNNPSGISGTTYAILKIGHKGDEVREIQNQLIKLGYSVGPDGADGDYGSNTEKAVTKFQIDHLLEVDGRVGNETRKKLKELIDEKAKASKPKVTVEDPEDPKVPRDSVKLPEIKMEEDDENDSIYVKLAQSALVCWGYSIIITGIFVKEMEQKVCDFQSHKGLVANGIINDKTWKALLAFSV
ncbi:MAG: peptidoglycan-binding protein, partial [Bacteroidaceae bacterium]|nr:peptidoglycan-binding protein [Bacteroidaceae bacterium]